MTIILIVFAFLVGSLATCLAIGKIIYVITVTYECDILIRKGTCIVNPDEKYLTRTAP